jgi:hypothetical protein
VEGLATYHRAQFGFGPAPNHHDGLIQKTTFDLYAMVLPAYRPGTIAYAVLAASLVASMLRVAAHALP